MTPEEERITSEAIEFANRNKKVIARELTNKDNIDNIDHHLREKYTEDEIRKLIGG